MALLARGHTVVVFTTRPEAIVAPWLAKHGFPAMEITAQKKPFWCIVDDRAIHFDGAWDNAMMQSIETFKPYWIGGKPADCEHINGHDLGEA